MQEPLLAENVIHLYAERIVNPWVTIHRTRLLPHPGQILRRRGDRVAGDTVIGETDVPGGYLLIELDRELGPRAREARAVMLKKVGQNVLRDEVIARTGDLFQREYTSPVNGSIFDMRDSRVLIEVAPQHIEVAALYPGEIVGVMPRSGVVIETTGALIQGDLGFGRSCRATLHCPVPTGDVPLLAGQITDEHVGGILIGGRTLDAAAIEQAVEARVRGVIVGSLRSGLLPVIQESGLALIVCEGLGDTAMPARTFDLLADYAGQEVCFAPAAEGTAQAHKPEILCYARGSDASEPGEEGGTRPALTTPGAILQAGTRVRVLRAPYLYAEGEIASLPEVPQRLASGLYAWGAEVILESASRVFVPFENLETIR
jgi:hypothetical protein